MGRYESAKPGRLPAVAAAVAVTLALGAFVNGLFAPAPTFLAAQVVAASRAQEVTEVTIIPSRIEVSGARTRHVAQGAASLRAALPGS